MNNKAPMEHVLANGIRILFIPTPSSEISHCAIVLNIGSRDEQQNEQGLAHFWEHMAFKGTKTRNYFHINNRLDSVGGELNAYTTKEKISFYATSLKRHFERSLDLLIDIVFRSTFPQKEIEKEKGVIQEEISMYLDSPEDAIQDEFEELLFPEHSLGYNILGHKESVSSFTTSSFQHFVRREVDPSKIVIAIAACFEFEQIIKKTEKFLSGLEFPTSNTKRTKPSNFKHFEKTLEKPIHQTHYMLGGHAPGLNDQNRIPFYLLINILGGSGMNAKLNMELREKNGLAYTADANFTSYTDIGWFSIYFATDPKQTGKAEKLTKKILEQFKQRPLGRIQLQQAKDQLMGQIAIAEENKSSLSQAMAKRWLDLGRVPTHQELFDAIQGISSKQLQELANTYLNWDKLGKLIYSADK